MPTQPLMTAVQVRWEGSCVTRESLVPLVAAALERETLDSNVTIDVSGADAPRLHARFELKRDGRRLAFRAFEDVPGDCQDLLTALSLAMAIAIENVVQPRPLPAPEPTGPPPVRDEPNEGIWWLETLATWEPERGVSGAGGIGLGFAPPGLTLNVGVFGALPRSHALAEGSTKSWRIGGRALACLDPTAGKLAPRLCAGGIAGPLFAQGQGFEEDRMAVGFWAALLLRASLMWSPSDGVSIGPSLEAELRPVRPTLVLRDAAGKPIATSPLPVFALATALSVELRL